MTLQEFVTKYTGKFVEYHSYDPAAKNQCVDSVNQWLDEGLGLQAIIGTNAIDFPGKAVANGMDWIPNTPEGIPQPGDLIVYEGTVGHIDIALEGCTTSKIVAFSQNYPTGSPCVVRTGTYLRPKVVGWIHPKGTMTGLPENYPDIIHNSTQWDETCKALELGESKSAGYQQVVNIIGGYKSRITTLENQVGENQAEIKNRIEQVSRVEKEVLRQQESIDLLTNQLKSVSLELDEMAKAKGKIAIELEQSKKTIETLKEQSSNGQFTITIRELIQLLLNKKITLSKG